MAIDWTEIQKKHAGQWVALADDEVTVVGFGATAKEAVTKAALNGYPNASLTYMPKELIAYFGYFL